GDARLPGERWLRWLPCALRPRCGASSLRSASHVHASNATAQRCAGAWLAATERQGGPRRMYMASRWFHCLMVAALVTMPPLLGSGCVGHTRGRAVLVVSTPPPPPPTRQVVIERSRPGYQWVPGHWVRRGSH